MTDAPLLVLCPSRGRPHNINRLATTWRQTATGAADLLVAVDDDDPYLDAYRILAADEGLHITVGPRLRLGGTLNKLAVEHAGQRRAIGFCGDDHRPAGLWDQPILDALDRLGSGIVYGNDGIHGAALPTAVFMTSDIVQTLGYMVPVGMTHLYLDNVWKLWGERMGRLTYLPDVVIEHVHPVAGKADWDAGYREANDPSLYAADAAAFQAYVATGLDADIEKLRGIPAVC